MLCFFSSDHVYDHVGHPFDNPFIQPGSVGIINAVSQFCHISQTCDHSLRTKGSDKNMN